jgi:hypothetical protein
MLPRSSGYATHGGSICAGLTHSPVAAENFYSQSTAFAAKGK